MVSRRHARREALDILYQADTTGGDPLGVLREWGERGQDVAPFARELVEQAAARLAELDEVIGRHARGWTVRRMAAVDRAILRLGCLELLHRDDVPAAVAINEAVEAAKELSTEDSGRFVNGILGQIAREMEIPEEG